MAAPVKKLAARRRRNIVLFLTLTAVLLVIEAAASAALFRTAIPSGWLLALVIVVLTLYNARKKLPFLQLGSSATWLQIHVYLGLLSAIIFCVHLRWRTPNGILESILAAFYLAVFFSGVFGFVVSRIFARRLGVRGGEVLFGRITPMMHYTRARVERLVVQCMQDTESTAVPEFYAQQLKPYFHGPRHFWRHLILSGRPLQRLLADLRSQERYLNETEIGTMRQIADYVRQKDDLDYHHAHQVTLKYWLFAHVPLTYALIVFVVIHVVLVHAFTGATL